jgi:uncharacterized membrane protein
MGTAICAKASGMIDRLPQIIIMLSGAALIIIGLVFVGIQFQHEWVPGFVPPPKGIETSPTGALELTTTHVGLIIIAIGACLEIVGYFAAMPRKHRLPHSK